MVCTGVQEGEGVVNRRVHVGAAVPCLVLFHWLRRRMVVIRTIPFVGWWGRRFGLAGVGAAGAHNRSARHVQLGQGASRIRP